MPLEARVMPNALSAKEIYDHQTALTEIEEPTAFHLIAPLLDRDRMDTVLAATDSLTLRLKVYASGGENEPHAHPNEGLIPPRGSLYRFSATGTEPLVMIRIGSPNQGRQGYTARNSRGGRTMTGDSAENRTVVVKVKAGARFG